MRRACAVRSCVAAAAEHQAVGIDDRRLGVACAEELAAAWAAVAARVDEVGRYCGHLLADYLVLAAIPLPPIEGAMHLHAFSALDYKIDCVLVQNDSVAERVLRDVLKPAEMSVAGDGGEADTAWEGPLPRDTAGALRRGAYALYGACGPTEVSCKLHVEQHPSLCLTSVS